MAEMVVKLYLKRIVTKQLYNLPWWVNILLNTERKYRKKWLQIEYIGNWSFHKVSILFNTCSYTKFRPKNLIFCINIWCGVTTHGKQITKMTLNLSKIEKSWYDKYKELLRENPHFPKKYHMTNIRNCQKKKPHRKGGGGHFCSLYLSDYGILVLCEDFYHHVYDYKMSIRDFVL